MGFFFEYNGYEDDLNKEYKLLFKGEYLNGKRNGKGKEYDYNDKLVFEGEYLNGKIWNGKGYNTNDKIEFEINDGKGYIKEYDFDGKLEFEGEYLNGKRNGKGKEYDLDGKIIFEGIYYNGEKYKGIGFDKSNNKAYELIHLIFSNPSAYVFKKDLRLSMNYTIKQYKELIDKILSKDLK